MIIRIEKYSNLMRGVEVSFTAENKVEEALLGWMATNTAKFGEYAPSTKTLLLHGKVS